MKVMNETLSAIMERWLYDYKRSSVKTATFERLVTSYKAMLPYPVAHVRIMDLTTFDVQSYINRMLDDGYAYTTIKKQYHLISGLIRFLLGEGVPVRPVYLNVRLPAASKHDNEAYTKPEQARLLAAADESPGGTAMVLMLETGMRIGEVLALSWRDILWERRAIRIHATLVNPQGQKKSFVQEGAKSKTSNRTIPLSSRAVAALERINTGQDGLIFPSAADTGTSVGYNAMRMQIRALCLKAGVPYRGMHVFRHTFATNCYYKGCDVKILSKLLGHSSVTVTYNTYIHLFGDALEEMRSVIN